MQAAAGTARRRAGAAAAALALTLLTAACGGGRGREATAPTTSTTAGGAPPTTAAGATTSSSTAPAPGGTGPATTTRPSRPGGGSTSTTEAPLRFDWRNRDSSVSAGGWTFRRCEGDALFLCVSRGGPVLGSAELLRFPDDAPARTLRDRVDEYYRELAADRRQGCGATYVFTPLPPADATVAGRAGLRYGFTGAPAPGRPVTERTASFMTRDGTSIWVFHAEGFRPGSCLGNEGAVFSVEQLEQLEPVLARVVAGSVLPTPS